MRATVSCAISFALIGDPIPAGSALVTRRGMAFGPGRSERDWGFTRPPVLEQEVQMPSMKESAVRARARARGYEIRKSRDRSIHADNLGDYMLVDVDRNFVVLGERFNASLE